MSAILPPRVEGAIRLPDGRTLGYAEYGPAEGRTILWFHGTPGARRQIAPQARALANRRKVRLIAVERPGIGDSTSHSYRALADWAADIELFCDAQGIDKFAVCGLSGGGPYALACAHYLHDRVLAAAVLGGVAPAMGMDAVEGGVTPLVRVLGPGMKYLRPPLNRLLVGLVRGLQSQADRAVELFARFMPPGDQAMFEDRGLRDVFVEDIVLGSRNQMQALLHDVVLFGRDWGFALADIEAPVYLFYGDADNIVPLRHGEHMAARLPNAELRVRPGEGHLGGLGASTEVFDSLLAHWPRRRK
jgi:pimeloyl-ACP methyl ester carboxylesterase